ncbi:MAG: biotin/lipoyl-binding protein [Candidatus Promineofilum sp.]|nr:biotin/lipoyl-binding protein [Promineifilum sp.]MBP9656419.1 biotin/lipoyl-binding protein [Promineifilum sp.]
MTAYHITLDDHEYEVELKTSSRNDGRYELIVNGQPLSLIVPNPTAFVSDVEWLIIDGRPYEIVFDPNLQWINAYDGLHTVDIRDRSTRTPRPRSGDGRVKAPIPGLITRVLVEPGTAVSAGQPLLILEAMKMENEIRAPFDGVVSSLAVGGGETVVRNQVLAEVQ